MNRKALTATLALSAMMAGLGVATATAAHPSTHQQEVNNVRKHLQSLAVAEETYLTDNNRYGTTKQMRTEGYRSSGHTTVHVVWYDGARSYCLTGVYRGHAHGTHRSYDSAKGGKFLGPTFSCAAHRPAGAHTG